MSPQYTHQQQVFCLNFLSNIASNHKASQTELQAYATCAVNAVLSDSGIQNLIGEWKVVWGPVVYQAPLSNVSDNAMFVARSEATGEYVVAISGTNPISWFGWLIEDFKLRPPQEWPFAFPLDPSIKISFGTSVGIQILQHQMADKGHTFTDFMTATFGNETKPRKVTFSGHSLGGALSPTLALAYRDQQGQEGSWDPKGLAEVHTLFTAGPTPGNNAFAKRFNTRMNGKANRIWNSIDIVPHAWQVNQLQQTPYFYEPHIEPNPMIHGVVNLAIANSQRAGEDGCVMTQLLPDVKPFKGEFNPDLPSIQQILLLEAVNHLIDHLGKKWGWSEAEIKLAKMIADRIIKGGRTQNVEERVTAVGHELVAESNLSLEDLENFLKNLAGLLNYLMQAGYQHVGAYIEHIGVTEYYKLSQTVAAQCCPSPS